jgi:NAD(P)H-flavin reductase
MKNYIIKPIIKEQKGFFELVVKTYPTGVVSSYLDKLKVK